MPVSILFACLFAFLACPVLFALGVPLAVRLASALLVSKRGRPDSGEIGLRVFGWNHFVSPIYAFVFVYKSLLTLIVSRSISLSPSSFPVCFPLFPLSTLLVPGSSFADVTNCCTLIDLFFNFYLAA